MAAAAPEPARPTLSDRLARVTTSGRRIRELDGLRFIAIATVVVQHTFEVVTDHDRAAAAAHLDGLAVLVRDWRIGVELFFVISGFILALPFAAHHLLGEPAVPLKPYYWRRVTRLEPPYLLTLLLWYAVLVFYWHEPAGPLLPHLLASAVYLHNVAYHHGPYYMSTINSVAWSLEVEVQFYLLAPWLAAAAFGVRRPWVRRALLVGAGLAVNESHKLLTRAGVNPPPTLYDYLPLFLMGFVLADVYLTDWRRDPPPARWADAVAVVGWVLLPFWFQDPTIHGHRFLPAAAFPLVLYGLCHASFRGPLVRRALGWGPVMTVGGMCYSIYLLHFPMLRILGRYAPIPLPGTAGVGLNTAVYTLLWGVPVMGASVAFFLLVEKPCMRRDWPERLAAWLAGRPLPGPPMPAPVSAEAVLDVPPSTTGPLSENQPVP